MRIFEREHESVTKDHGRVYNTKDGAPALSPRIVPAFAEAQASLGPERLYLAKECH